MRYTNIPAEETARTGFWAWFGPAALIILMTVASWSAVFVVVHDFVQSAASSLNVTAETSSESVGK